MAPRASTTAVASVSEAANAAAEVETLAAASAASVKNVPRKWRPKIFELRYAGVEKTRRKSREKLGWNRVEEMRVVRPAVEPP